MSGSLFYNSINSISFTAKFELVFVVTQENAYSQRFRFKLNRKKELKIPQENGTSNF